MITIQGTMVSEEIIEKNFVCELNACKGACCVEGDAGAPLESTEVNRLSSLYPVIKAFLREEGIKAIEAVGTHVVDLEGDYTTPCVDGNKECAYTVFESGKAQCGIEKAYLAGAIPFRKPISCHLYPIRITQYPEFDVLNYDRWSICSPACSLGDALKIPIYVFLKEALLRKYGEEWYEELLIEIEK